MKSVKYIQNTILGRYKKHGRKLPRRQTRDPYAIHVSEVMLQQTQVDRVIPYFLQWMKDYPDYQTLAKTNKSDLLRHRSGLGFNSRAIRLRECTKKVNNEQLTTNSKNTLPQIREELMKLPGIGPYTSAAIMAFAWNKEVPVIDTNIRRVLIFLFQMPENLSPENAGKFAQKLIPKGKSRDRHNALMDYGAMELTARKTKIKPLSKQSKFEGSDRQVRGRTMKQLVKRGTVNVKCVEEEFPHKEVRSILNGMVKEDLITLKKGVIIIAG